MSHSPIQNSTTPFHRNQKISLNTGHLCPPLKCSAVFGPQDQHKYYLRRSVRCLMIREEAPYLLHPKFDFLISREALQWGNCPERGGGKVSVK